jgi:serine/threonine protein kinase
MMQFLREVRVLAKLSHPSLPRVHDYFCDGAACYVVMDELSERTLADVLRDAAQEGFAPALPPVMIAQLGLELARALGYLHQQRPPLVLGGLRAEDIALPSDGPVQLMSLGALSMVPSVSSASLPGFVSMPTLPVRATRVDWPSAPAAAPEDEETLPEGIEAPTPAVPPSHPEPGDDLFSLGLLLRELVGGAEVVARVMERLQRPEEALQSESADDSPPISLALAGVIQIAAHAEPARRFQSATAFETALLRAWMVERRIVRQAERGWRDERATRLENGEDDRSATSVDVVPLRSRQHQEVATRHLSAIEANVSEPQVVACWRCGGHNAPDSQVCRVCGARQPVAAERPVSEPRSGVRPTRRLPPGSQENADWADWGEDTNEATSLPSSRATATPRRTRPLPYRQTAEGVWTSGPLRRNSTPVRSRQGSGQRLLWALVWVCFSMAFVLGSATVIVTYLALH